MPSSALVLWRSDRSSALDEFEQIHKAIGHTGAGTRNARQQINQAYVLMLTGQFQGFCRDLHTEGVDHLASCIQPRSLQPLMTAEFQFARKLDVGNPSSGNVGSDFNRFGLKFWDAILAYQPSLALHQHALAEMNDWRNAIAHQSFDAASLGGAAVLRHVQVRTWRKSCDLLAGAVDAVLANQLAAITGVRPW